jgi:hypothetical protein
MAAPSAGFAQDRDCPSFSTQAEAQAFFNAQGAGDPHTLDADNDGIACETLPGGGSRVRLADTGLEAWIFAAAGLVCIAGAVGLRRWQPRGARLS